MSGKVSTAFRLIGLSWQILKQDKVLFLFPLISFICVVLLHLSVLIPLWHYFKTYEGQAFFAQYTQITTSDQILRYGLLFLYYYIIYIVINFFNTGLIACVLHRMRGENSSFGDGAREAMQRLDKIAGWTLIDTSLGLVLQIIEDKSKVVGRVVSELLGIAFSIASLFVIPIIVAENISPIDALKESSSLFRKMWGEQFTKNLGFKLILIMFLVIGLVLIEGTAITTESTTADFIRPVPFPIFCASVGVIYFIMLFLFISTLESIFQTALYFYAKNGDVPLIFDEVSLRQSFKTKLD